MCGINLLINPSLNGEASIQKMMQATAHRGPDASGFERLAENVFLAGNRLKILDLTDASNQPFWSQDKNAVLVWNGALYNYQDLKNELVELGYTFRTQSDSEVLLYWLMAFGTKKIASLKGMFAFVYANIQTHELLVARDPSGQKPLYSYHSGSFWAFSSESKGILAALDKTSSIDENQFLPYFHARHSFPDKTFYRGIHQVLPGHGMVWNWKTSTSSPFQWDYPIEKQTDFHQAKFETLLKNAVRTHFHTDRPVGMVLSGGTDSSLLYALWHEQSGIALPTYTATFDQALQHKYEDPIFANKLVQKYPADHHEVKIDVATVMENWPAYIESLDQPIGDSAGFLTWMIANKAKEKVNILISGAGADELFGGYNRHKAFKNYLKNPKAFLWLKKFYQWIPMPLALEKMLKSIAETPEQTFVNFSTLFPLPKDSLSLFKPWYPQFNAPFKNALEFDRTFYLVNDVIKVHDNSCMAHGIEGRSPYLDHDLVVFSKSMPENLHLELEGKAWIKGALEDRGLGFIANRKKLGFGLPLQEWFQKEPDFREWVFGPIREMVVTWGEILPPEMLKLARCPEKAKTAHFLLIWNLFLLASWLNPKDAIDFPIGVETERKSDYWEDQV
ncbi:hypothetical protein P872_08250 [Rhodonellum psychrophilum GCM71 = DSM 17998]|uniref:asparagine synthase (glutamine-hydrolyzing) n=2 Tax=Rhodonellum TaxID=336827 RepID=U5BZP3_9BACT|nr:MULTISPECIES: asparagine synthase (glutamine-hydrolyzing) [Rhodonellum]ERM82151.1 hypothetical protein P872_08250 [Rhodonellum psychrophilum GCM71 = DSM 17998]SDY63410.1 asparagine synthase (glutamine-hydrolysing) [Rhodonellum ikkaensis]